jgi:hypothetical protein
MDEPFYFGHIFNNGGALHPEEVGCHAPVTELASDIATKIVQLRSLFPNIRVGDVEPFNRNASLPELAAWLDAFQAATGERLAYFRLDMDWRGDWRQRLPGLIRLLEERGIPLQVIYNGSGADQSDEAWVAGAAAHYHEFEAEARIIPDAAVIQYWTPHPERVLPETDPRTATGLIEQYVRWKQSRGGR